MTVRDRDVSAPRGRTGGFLALEALLGAEHIGGAALGPILDGVEHPHQGAAQRCERVLNARYAARPFPTRIQEDP